MHGPLFSSMLAQGGTNPMSLLTVADPPPLDGAPLFQRLLFENPLALTLALLVLGVVLYVVFNSKGRYKLGLLLAGACIIVSGVAWIFAGLVVTNHEKMRESVRELVRGVAQADLATLETALGPDARLTGVPTLSDLGRSDILAVVRQQLRPGATFEVKDYAILEEQTTIDGPNTGRVQVKVRVIPKQWNFPNLSWWSIGLRSDDNERWNVYSIKLLGMSGN